MDTCCRLCGSKEPLRDSHILPEFLYRPTYGPSHTAMLLDPHRGRRGKRQKGFSERLLCDRCEQKVNRWDAYFARVWLHDQDSLRPNSLPGPTVRIVGLDYDLFKLFHLSIVWRAGVSSLRAFANVSLGGQEPKLRQRLLDEDPGARSDYPFVGVALRDPADGGFQDKFVKTPDATRFEGHHVYVFLFGGVLWHYYVSSHSTGRFVPSEFTRAGALILTVQDSTENVYVRALAADVQSKLGV